MPAMLTSNHPDIADLLKNTRTIAVVGLSANPLRPSHLVASYMQSQGYRIIPVNPNYSSILGETCYPDLLEIPASIEVDMVNIFRKVEAIPSIVEGAIQRKVQGIWMQEGIFHYAAAEKASSAGLWVVMDRCLMVEHRYVARVQ
jgi:predicted CoA-binding protein